MSYVDTHYRYKFKMATLRVDAYSKVIRIWTILHIVRITKSSSIQTHCLSCTLETFSMNENRITFLCFHITQYESLNKFIKPYFGHYHATDYRYSWIQINVKYTTWLNFYFQNTNDQRRHEDVRSIIYYVLFLIYFALVTNHT